MSKAVSTYLLTEKILKAKKAYYKGKPIMSDFDYDKLENNLKVINPDAPVLQMVGYDPDFVNEKPEDL